MSVLIRPERSGDEDAIHALTQLAFAGKPYSDGSEPAIIRALRQAGDLTLSLIADEDDRIVGHVAFSPVTINEGPPGWFGLGPISVVPERQKQGIGRALIREGLQQLLALGAKGCALIGNPDVYRGSGFESDGALSYRDLDLRHIQRLVLSGPAPSGELRFAPAFDVEVFSDR